MTDRHDVAAAFRWILGRDPSDAEIGEQLSTLPNRGADAGPVLAQRLLSSAEFRQHRLAISGADRFAPFELDRPRVAFVHIEKCGGTTLHAMLETQFPPARICPERFDRLADWTVRELAAFDLFSGHFDLFCCRSIPGTVRAVTMLREPRARLMSLYRFWKAHKPDPRHDAHPLVPLARETEAERFFAHPWVATNASILDAMTAQLVRTGNRTMVAPGNPLRAAPEETVERAWDALRSMAGFGLMERMDDSRRLLNRALGLAMPALPPRQVLAEIAAADPALSLPPPDPMTPALVERLDALTRLDRILYGRAQALFAKRLAALDASPGPVWRLMTRALGRRRTVGEERVTTPAAG
jgi:hypothetical protein